MDQLYDLMYTAHTSYRLTVVTATRKVFSMSRVVVGMHCLLFQNHTPSEYQTVSHYRESQMTTMPLPLLSAHDEDHWGMAWNIY